MSAGAELSAASRPATPRAPLAARLGFVKVSPAWPLLIILVVFFTLGNPHFLTPFNLSSVLRQTVLIGVLAVGLTPLIISGNIDLSVGALAGFAACLIVFLETPIGVVPAILTTLAACFAIGLFNGLIVEKLALNSIIVTLAMSKGLRGLTFLVFGTQTALAPDANLTGLGNLKLGLVGVDVVVFFVVAILVSQLLRATVHGINTYAIGGNRRAALDAGVDVSWHVLMNFALSGAMAGLVGLILVAELGAASPVYGQDYELWAVIAVVLGGTRLAGGRGGVLGSIVAALSLTILRNGMNLMRIEVRYVLIIMGVVLIAALIFDRLRSGEPETAE
jgi:ribose transport system permease protein